MFSALLQQKQVLGLLPGIAICHEAPSVNHLIFADDNILYAQASIEACYEIQDVIETYGRASGQLVNFNKSSIVFNKNVDADLQDDVASLMGVEIVEPHERYLGLPTYVGRKKTTTFQYIMDNLAKKLKHWQGKMLSDAGKDTLIRVVAQALPFYVMGVFQLTKNFVRIWNKCVLDFGREAQKTKEKFIGKHGISFAILNKIEVHLPILGEASLGQESCYGLALTGKLVLGKMFEFGWMLGPGLWDDMKIRSLSNEVEAAAILAIPLSQHIVHDRVAWKLEKKGSGRIGMVLRDTTGQFLAAKGRPVMGLMLGRIYEGLGVLLETLPNVRIVHTAEIKDLGIWESRKLEEEDDGFLIKNCT
ncbi:uncharacterized protein LOC133711383 [Rosa rugosa]|uniref:uncharacterized protein LOC133711383 n=1 Tax=Rosa rugosa TaxID=74645 RepID=UPI002B401632|nr:uncharacterized protein LOC133711383 [Rosa rugosa]